MYSGELEFSEWLDAFEIIHRDICRCGTSKQVNAHPSSAATMDPSHAFNSPKTPSCRVQPTQKSKYGQ